MSLHYPPDKSCTTYNIMTLLNLLIIEPTKVGNHPAVTKDVSGWSGEDIGLLIQVMHYWNMTESYGTTGFVENIYKIDFSILDSGEVFDPLTVNRFRQVRG